jgi:succinoglycan biosynthesis protein ExoA
MSDSLPLVTVVIPARPGQAEVEAVSASRRLDYPPALVEILVARGSQPSAQRNLAAREARGEWIYFLDDDSVPEPGNLRRGLVHGTRLEVVMVGGPALCPPDAPVKERLFQAVMGSWLAFGPSRARYAAVGQVRESGEKELILCNLLVRKTTLLAAGGFDEALYPNEENALMDQVRADGNRLIYDPQFVIWRRPRPTLGAFARMLFGYGRGRAEQFRLHPTWGSALNFVPPLFCLYVLLTPLLPAALARLWVVYGAALIVQALVLPCLSWARRAAVVPLMFLSHIGYGLGFWYGLGTRLRGRQPGGLARVQLERIATS